MLIKKKWLYNNFYHDYCKVKRNEHEDETAGAILQLFSHHSVDRIAGTFP